LGIEGSIQYIDGFGNLVTNIPGEAVADKNWYLVINKGKKQPKKKKPKQKKTKKNSKHKLKPKQQKPSSLSCLIPSGQTYGDVALGQLVALVGSHDWVEIALNGGNAQQQLKIDWGAKIQVIISNQS
jgi:S-adenosylmethionine hydrolase